MTRTNLRNLIWGLMLVALVTQLSCGGGGGGGTGSVTHTYRLSLSGSQGSPIGGVKFKLTDPGAKIDEKRITYKLLASNKPYCDGSYDEASGEWTFYFLAKAGAIASQDIMEIKTEDVLTSSVSVKEACDTSGVLLDSGRVSISFGEVK